MANETPRTVLTDIDIPFGSLVVFFVKAFLAAIPAFILVSLIFAGIGLVLRLLFGFDDGFMMRGMMRG